jgi:chitinase
MLKVFMLWLIKGPHPTGYTAASLDWVSNVIIGGINPTSTIVPPRDMNWDADTAFFQMTFGLGGDHNPGGLALAQKGMNGRKQKFFEGGTPDSRNSFNNLQTRLGHRNTAGVFSYMRNTVIWGKFVASSQHMEQTLAEFDANFNWNGQNAENVGQPGIPQRAAGQPVAGLRDLYCYWIDMFLRDIEAKGVAWWNAAEPAYRQSSYGSDNDGIKWLKNVMNANGPISPTTMRFLHARNQHGPFGSNNNPTVLWAQSNYDSLWGNGPAGPF